MDIISVAASALIGTFISLSIKKEAPVFAACVSLATGILIFFYTAQGLELVTDTLMKMTEESGINSSYAAMVIRIAAISYICQLIGDICADAGEKAAADKVEMAGKIAIAVISSPIILSLMEAVVKYL